MRTTRKELLNKAREMGAVNYGNIYNLENLGHDLRERYKEQGTVYRYRIAYAVGMYGNNGALDYWELIDSTGAVIDNGWAYC